MAKLRIVKTEESRIDVRQSKKFLFSPQCPYWLKISSGPLSITGVIFGRIKRPGPETDYSSMSGAEVKDIGCRTSILPFVFKARCLIG
jgi:hypothetical protein